MKTRTGEPITLFTDAALPVVERQFAWMAQYKLDGVALQRFATSLLQPDSRALLDLVLANVRRAAEDNGRAFFVMYDLSGMKASDLHLVAEDWHNLEAHGLTRSPAYQHHRGHPLLGLWGLGFRGRPMTPADAQNLLAALHRTSAPFGGITILGGVPRDWRTGTGGAAPDPGWRDIWPQLGIISPWTVGSYGNDAEADAYLRTTMAADLRVTAHMQVDYMPVVFPGFSWANLTRARHAEAAGARNQIPRRCGRFYWRQVFNALRAGATMLYGAMFDEVDEGTAMFKLLPAASGLPAGQWYLTLDADGCALPSDWYLRLAGAATAALHAGRPVSPQLPLTLPPK